MRQITAQKAFNGDGERIAAERCLEQRHNIVVGVRKSDAAFYRNRWRHCTQSFLHYYRSRWRPWQLIRHHNLCLVYQDHRQGTGDTIYFVSPISFL